MSKQHITVWVGVVGISSYYGFQKDEVRVIFPFPWGCHRHLLQKFSGFSFRHGENGDPALQTLDGENGGDAPQ